MSSVKAVLKQISPLLLSSVIATVISVVLAIYLGRLFQPEAYGRVLFFVAIFSNARFVVSMGLGTKIINDMVEANDRDRRTEIFYSQLLIRTALGLLVTLGLLIWGLWHNDLLIAGAGGVAFIAGLVDFYQSILLGLQRRGLVALIAICQPAVYALLLLQGEHSVVTTITAFSLSFVVTLVVSAIAFIFSTPGITRPHFSHVSIAYIRQSWKEMGKLSALGILQQLILTVPIVFLGGQKEFGNSAYIGVVLSLVLMFDNLTNLALWGWLMPTTRRFYVETNLTELRKTIAAYSWFVLLIGIWLSAVTLNWSDYILELLYKDRYVGAIPLLSLAAVLIYLIAYNDALAVSLIGIHRLNTVLRSFTLQTLGTVGATFFFTKISLPADASLGFIMGSIILCYSGSAIYYERTLHRTIDWKPQLLKSLFLFLAASFICYLARRLSLEFVHLDILQLQLLVLPALSALFTALGLLLIVRLLPMEDR